MKISCHVLIFNLFVSLSIISCSEKVEQKAVYVTGVFNLEEYIDGSKSGQLQARFYLSVNNISSGSQSINSDDSINLTWEKLNSYFFPNDSFDGINSLTKEAKSIIGKNILITGVAYDYCGKKILLKPSIEPNESCFIFGAYNHIELLNIEQIKDYKKYINY